MQISQYFSYPPSNSSEKLSIIMNICQSLASFNIEIITIFKELHVFFVSDQDENRLKASQLIRSIFQRTNKILNFNDFFIIFDFFIEKSKDIMIIEEIMKILLILLENHCEVSWFNESAKRFLSFFYNNFVFFLPAYNQTGIN